jgi:Flp pilus assembly protein TadG
MLVDFVRRFICDDNGNVAMIMGLSLLAVTSTVGVAVDSMIAYSVEDDLQKSLDAAGLAAGRVIDPGDLLPEAERVFNTNFASSQNLATLKSFSVVPSAEGDTIALKASVEVPTRLMRLAGYDTVTVSAETTINRAVRQMELALVMDNTGSMKSNNKIGAMKDAATNLINMIYGQSETQPNLWVSLVPYTAMVNIGNQRTGWLKPGDDVFNASNPFSSDGWKGCVRARPAPYDQTDDPPSVMAFTSFLYKSNVDNVWPPIKSAQSYENNGTGPNLGCGPAISPLMQRKSDVLAAIANMAPWHRGGTTGNLGLVWGWRTISPRWRGLWGGTTPANMPLDYDEPYSEKVVVLLTDGENQFYDWPNHQPDNGVGPKGSDDTAYGRLHEFGYTSLSTARQEIDRRLAATCAAMKAEGIIIYTITFGDVPSTSTQALYRDCASRPEYYFHSPKNEDLAKAFRTIGVQLSNLRISH